MDISGYLYTNKDYSTAVLSIILKVPLVKLANFIEKSDILETNNSNFSEFIPQYLVLSHNKFSFIINKPALYLILDNYGVKKPGFPITADINSIDGLIKRGVFGLRGNFASSYHIKANGVPYDRKALERLGYIRHPALKDGRSNRNIEIDGNKKPVLWVKRGTKQAEIGRGRVVYKYIDAQQITADSTL